MNGPDPTRPRHARAGRADGLADLLQATTPAEVADAIVALVQAQPGCNAASVLWSGVGGPASRGTVVPAPEPAFEQALVRLGNAGEPLVADDGHVILALIPRRALLWLDLARACAPVELLASVGPYLELAARHLRRALQLADLQDAHQQLARSEALQRALFAISDLAGSDLDMPRMLTSIHAVISTLMYGENFFIARKDPRNDTVRFIYYVDTEDPEGPDTNESVPLDSMEYSLTWHLLVGGRALMGSHAQLRRQVNGPLRPSGPDSIDWLGVPMVRDGEVLGGLVVQSYTPGIGFSEDDRALLEFVATHVLTALERKQSKDELEERVRLRTQELAEANRGLQQEVRERERAERLQATLYQLAQLATADIDEAEFYERVHIVVGELINADNFFISLLSSDRRKLVFPYYVDAGVRKAVERELGRGLSEYVLRTGRPLLGTLEDMHRLDRDGEVDIARVGRPALCWLGVPLRVGEDVIGLVVVQSYTEAVSYDEADQELLSFAALQIASSIHRRRTDASLQRAYAELELRVQERTRELRQQIEQRERIQEQLKHQVMHDALTGLPNRGFLRDRLERVLAILKREPGRRCALLYLDVDRFKAINDSLGHLAGDAFLQEIGQRLLGCVRDPDVVARLSGDEFAILLEDVPIPAAAVAVAQRVLEALAQPLQLAGRDVEPSASIGIAVGDESYGSADDLLRDADIALYRAKQTGRKRFELFDETLAQNVVDVLTMEGELRRGLQRGEFEPYLQPVHRLDGDAVVGYEALLRWNHPQHGLLGPAAFLQVAEEVGLIETIDWRLFERSCEHFLQLPDPGTFLTFNVSALHLRHADFDTRLLQLIERTGVPPWRLIVEVTEGSLLDNPEQVRRMLERLRAVGIGAALDDFGTGYSSLSYLHSLPLRMLKIDRSFVVALDADEHDTTSTVVAAILALARALNIQVIAEGIETPAQRQALLAMGCELGQGFLLDRPAPLAHWLHRAAAQRP